MKLRIEDLHTEIVRVGGKLGVLVRQRVAVDETHELRHGPYAIAPLEQHGGDVGAALRAAIGSLEWVLADPERTRTAMGGTES